MRYFAKVTNERAQSNKLQKAVAKLIIETMNRRIIENEQELERLKSNLSASIKELNETHKNCKPVTAKWWQPGIHGGDWQLDHYFICLHIYKEKI